MKRQSLGIAEQDHLPCGDWLVALIGALAMTFGLAGCSGSDTPQPAQPSAEMQAVLTSFESLGPKDIPSLTPAEARQNPTIADAVNKLLTSQGRSTDPTVLVPGVSSTDITVQGAAGMLPARVFTPDGAGPFPVVVYFHGGGWVIANRIVYDAGARGMARQANAIVISVDYRLAPESPFPAAWDDALAAYAWTITNAASLNGDPTLLALAGESAGGNLAVATAVAARVAGLTMPRAVVSVYPVAQTGSLETDSYKENANVVPLDRPTIEYFLVQLQRSGASLSDTRLNLVRANLAGLPPVTIINAQIDPLRDDGILLARALEAAGVPVQQKVYDGVTHEFFGTAAVVTEAQDAQAYAGTRLHEAFRK